MTAQIMNPAHPRWSEFQSLLIKSICTVHLTKDLCDGHLTQTRRIFAAYFPEVDLSQTLEFFISHGGFCDCEVLLNIL